MAKIKETAATLSLLCLLCLTSAQPEQCRIGSDNAHIASTPSRNQQFYLDTANPAPCTGRVTSWRVCYYGPDAIPSNSLANYWATYAVYRRMGSGNNVHYVRVSEMFRAVRTNVIDLTLFPGIDGEISRGGFNCYTDSLESDADDPVLTVQAGDILGACVFDPDGDIELLDVDIVITLPLDVVGEVSGETLLQMSTAECSRSDLPSDIPANQLASLESRRLHIYANIEAESMPLTPRTEAHASNITINSQAAGTPITTTKPTMPPHTPNSNTGIVNSTNKGSEAGRSFGAIVAGSTAGGVVTLFLLAAITTTIVYLVHVLKRKILSTTVGDESSTSVERSPPHETIVTITNPAYKLVQRQRATVTANRELEQVTRDPSTIGVEESTAIDTEPQESNDESQDSELKMEKNVAYQSSTTTQNNLIPLHLNMAYRYESRKAFNVNHHADDEEDYI